MLGNSRGKKRLDFYQVQTTVVFFVVAIIFVYAT